MFNNFDTAAKAIADEAHLTPPPRPWWTDLYNESQRETISVANVLEHYPNAPIIGRNHLALICKMAEMLNRVNESGVDILALYYPKSDSIPHVE